MTTILLAWELGARHGHCVNLRPIAEYLIREGHRVCFAARELATAKRVFQELPITYFQAPFLVENPSRPVRRPQTFAQILQNVGFGDDQQLSILTQAWRNLFALLSPDAIICEHAPTALLASRWTEMRRFVIGTGFFSPPDLTPLPNIRPGAAEEVSPEARRCEDQIASRINQLLSHDRLPRLDQLARLYADADANFLLTFPELDHYAGRANGEYCGSWNPSGGIVYNWPPGGPRLFAYLQPTSAAWRLGPILSVLQRLTIPTIAVVAGADSSSLDQFRSPHLQLLTEPVDMSRVGSHCDVAIHHGNAGTATALLLAGVPQLLIPLHLEQAVFSQRLLELGAGLAIRPDRLQQVPEKLTSILNTTSFRESALAFAQRHSDYRPTEQQKRIAERIIQSLAS